MLSIWPTAVSMSPALKAAPDPFIPYPVARCVLCVGSDAINVLICLSFLRQWGAPFTAAGARKMFARLGVAAGFDFVVHPHMLRHACGFQLANKGVDTRSLQAYLGHRNIQHTVRYTELTPARFNGFWED